VIRDFAVALLSGFITGVAAAAVVLWFGRDRIRERVNHRRERG
jgi:hypothetical protein